MPNDAQPISSFLATARGTVTIRAAVAEDAAPLRDLRLEALASHPAAFGADYAITAADPAEVWSERIAQYALDHSGVICVAAMGHQLVGMTGLVRGHWLKTRHSGTLWGVYVREDWRGLGVAEALLNACVAWARGEGLVTVKLAVITSNMAAIRCYARCGFSVYGIEPQVIYEGGVFHDELLMARTV